MNEITPIENSNSLIEATRERVIPPARRTLASVRISPGGYLAVAAVFTFISLILLRMGHDLAALTNVALTWIIIPIVIKTDRVSFDGERLFRRGLIAAFSRLIKGKTIELPVSDIERAETTAVRTVRRGGTVRYRYRTEVTGKGISLVFASGKGFRQLLKLSLATVADEKMDARTRELRDYLTDPRVLRHTVRLLGIASTSVLDNAAEVFPEVGNRRIRHQRAGAIEEISPMDLERARLLRSAANQLRIAGRLRESAEAFRRALLVTPNDVTLLYEFSRLLRSQASALGQARLLSRARAALRLAASRQGLAGSSQEQAGSLLARIGETFLELADVERAARAFRRAMELNPQTFRAQLGLADVALRDGKLAHVIHHYNDAARIGADEALVRFARREADYYARLNDDEDYLAGELRRINWLQSAQRVQRMTARAGFASILIALVGPYVSPAAGSMGLALASSSIIGWSGTMVAVKFLKTRRRFLAKA